MPTQPLATKTYHGTKCPEIVQDNMSARRARPLGWLNRKKVMFNNDKDKSTIGAGCVGKVVDSFIPMDVHVHTRAEIPSRLVTAAARESAKRQLVPLRGPIRMVRVRLTDRRLNLGMTRCQVDVELARNDCVSAYCVGSNPVVTVSDAFEQIARIVHERIALRSSPKRATTRPMAPTPSPVAQATDLLTS